MIVSYVSANVDHPLDSALNLAAAQFLLKRQTGALRANAEFCNSACATSHGVTIQHSTTPGQPLDASTISKRRTQNLE
jgi:hypothetical protein